MAVEIERRFLVEDQGWGRFAQASHRLRQAYISVTAEASVRIRIADDQIASLTIKSGKAGIERAEFEYPIPVDDAEALMALRMGHVIQKRRHIVMVNEARWEVDVFTGDLDGLVIAEIEFQNKHQHVELPDWLGKEITDDGRYSNAALSIRGLPNVDA
jgi:adenylate cyclase